MYFNILKFKILIKVSIRNESGVQVHGTGLPDASEGALDGGEILPSAQRRPIETSIYLNRIFSLFVSTHFNGFLCVFFQSVALCTSCIMFVLTQDRLNMDLDRDSLELMLNLLEIDAGIFLFHVHVL